MTNSGNNHQLPQSVRLNNPGNIRQSRQSFKGEVNHWRQKEFKEFVDEEYGFRALKRVLKTYIYEHGLDTIEKIIYRYAPPKDKNPTEKYIAFVCDETHIARDEKLKYTPMKIVPIMVAIARFEAGYLPEGWMHAAAVSWDMK